MFQLLGCCCSCLGVILQLLGLFVVVLGCFE